MMKLASKVLMISAASSMALAPVAAQANTRAISTASVSSSWTGQVMSYASLLCTMQSGGCILPLREPAPVVEAPVPEVPAVPVEEAAPVIAKKGGSGFLPLLFGIGGLLGGALALSSGGGSDDSRSPAGNQSNGAT